MGGEAPMSRVRHTGVRVLGVAAFALLLAPTPLRAAEPDAAGSSLEAQLATERASRAELEGQVQSLRTTVDELEQGRQARDAEMQELREAVADLRKERPSAAPTDLDKDPQKVGTVKERLRRYQAERQILERRGGVLLPAGQLVIEPGFQYNHFQRSRVDISGFQILPAIIVGRIDTTEVERDLMSAFVDFRYGLTDWLEAQVNVPYRWRDDKFVLGTGDNQMVDKDSGSGIGDLQFGLFAQVLEEAQYWPDIVLNVRGVAPTGDDFFIGDTGNSSAIGTGFWGWSVGGTMVRALDPAVVFASANYWWNLEDDKGVFGKIDPGNAIEYSLGLAFSLNERLALSFSYQQRFINRSTVDGIKVERTDLNVATLFVGTSYRINRLTSLSFNVGVGITDDAPDLSIEVRLPFRLPYRLPSLKLPSWPLFARGGDKSTRVALAGRD